MEINPEVGLNVFGSVTVLPECFLTANSPAASVYVVSDAEQGE